MQDIIAGSLIFLSFAYAGFKLYKFFKPAKISETAAGCDPELCSTCPQKGEGKCE